LQLEDIAWGHSKIDDFVITGTDGVLSAGSDYVKLHVFLPSGKKELEWRGSSEKAFRKMLQDFHQEICLAAPSEQYLLCLRQDLLVIKTIQLIYDATFRRRTTLNGVAMTARGIARNDLPISLSPTSSCRFYWPIIDQHVEEEVYDQLHTSISIYGNDGVFKSFEEEFKRVHERPKWHALLHNSGSNSLSALYFACNFSLGDEVSTKPSWRPKRAHVEYRQVIFPVYTFHATCSAAMHFGIRPVFVDTTSSGNMSATALERAITPFTKAVVITHMWGMPCEMTSLLAVLKEHPRILLLEDCSHAHGARINGQPVGTFGDGAAWSLQGQKVVSGGEGGIALTKHPEFHIRQLLWGHYNKRCYSEIPKNHPLRPFASTGSGLKNRAHPLAVRIALNQLRKLPRFLKFKSMYASRIAESLKDIPFLEFPPALDSPNSLIDLQPAWYALWFRFKADLAPKGLSRETFVKKLVDRGLVDVDIPRSTGLLHKEPLFVTPSLLLPHIFPAKSSEPFRHGEIFKVAQAFYDEIIKIPVWAEEKDELMVKYYIEVFKSVAADSM